MHGVDIFFRCLPYKFPLVSFGFHGFGTADEVPLMIFGKPGGAGGGGGEPMPGAPWIIGGEPVGTDWIEGTFIMGLPTIVSDIVVLREVLQIDAASPVAFLPPTDAAVWAGAIGKWLDTPPPIQVRDQFAIAMALKYSPDRMARSYLGLVRSAR